MPIAATCPGCGAPLSGASVVALAPICSHCGVVITSVGGTLGLTSAYGVGDPIITRRRVEADLAVFREYQMKYRGMLEACKQQLGWGVEQYAQLPQPPDLLQLEPVPSFWTGLLAGLGAAVLWFLGSAIVCAVATVILEIIGEISRSTLTGKRLDHFLAPFIVLIVFGGCIVAVFIGPLGHFRAKIRNGSKPSENSRRLKAYAEAKAAALRTAEPIKAAQDHRLRCQIRELEGLAKTVGEKEAEVRRILATL